MANFIIKLIKADKSSETVYNGTDATTASIAYQTAFTEALIVQGIDTLETSIDGTRIERYFDLLLEDVYGSQY